MFRVGQKCVCVNAANNPGFMWGKTEAPKEGAIYTVVRCFVDHEGDEIVHLLELPRDDVAKQTIGPMAGYLARRFRPIVEKKTSIAIFHEILNTVSRKHKERV